MKNINNIVVSNTAPRKEDLWVHEGRIKYFSTNGWTNLTAGLFDAGFLYDAATALFPKDKVLTKEQIDALNKAVVNKDIIYLSVKVNEEFSFKVMVVFTGYNTTSKEMSFSASDFYNHYKIVVNTETGKVDMSQSSTSSTLSVGEEDTTYVFIISDNPEDKKLNRQLAADILFDKVETVRIKGTLNGITYDTIGVYHDGYITALQKNEYVVFNVNFEDGSITAETITKVNKTLPYVEIMIGDSEEVKQYNSENIPNGEFFIHSDYGYGVGTFQDGFGGFAHITNAYGNEAFYKLNIDGSVMPDRDYVKPNEPYTLQINQELIGTRLEDVVSSALKKAGEIVVITTSGPITYTRTTDSNDNMVYFTDDRKDGQVVLLTYNNTTKMLNVAEVPIKRATANTVGGITKGKAITNADGSNAIDKFNELLSELRRIGVIEE